MFPRKRWFASRPGVSLPGTHKKALTRGRSSSNWSQTKKLAGLINVLVSKKSFAKVFVGRIQQCSSFKNPLPRYLLAGFSNFLVSKIPLPRYLPGKMMTDVALNIHFKVDKYFLTKYSGNICDQPMDKYITWCPITPKRKSLICSNLWSDNQRCQALPWM